MLSGRRARLTWTFSFPQFGGTIAGFSLGWTSLAADYTVYQRANTANWKIFLSTYVGLNVPLVFVESLGALMMSTLDVKETWAAVAKNEDGSTNLGGLLGAPLIGRASSVRPVVHGEPRTDLLPPPLAAMGGFGRFLLVVLALSIVANNIPVRLSAFGRPS